MEAMIRRAAAAFSVLALSGLSGCGLIKFKSDPPQLDDRVYLLGPEAFPVCNGWVELWARVDTTSWVRDVKLYVKASPGKDGGWTIGNQHLLVELPKKNVQRRRKVKDLNQIELSSHELSAGGDSTNVGEWTANVEGLDPSVGLMVYLKPPQGCGVKGEKIQGMLISSREFTEGQ